MGTINPYHLDGLSDMAIVGYCFSNEHLEMENLAAIGKEIASARVCLWQQKLWEVH